MGLELKTKDYKTIINSLLLTYGIPYSEAFDLLLREVETYHIEDFIELLLDKINDKQ